MSSEVKSEAVEARSGQRSAHQIQANAALAFFNETITRVAFEADVPLIDLRLICNEDADFANPIEPSARGGEKISGAIAEFVGESDGRLKRSWILR